MHTPDGSPCGLLNHLSHTCKLITSSLDVSHVPSLLTSHGMTQVFASHIDGTRMVVVQLDGRIIGWASPSKSKHLANLLRKWKTEGTNRVPLDLEIGYVPITKGGQYPGLYLFSSRARMMRPVRYLENGKVDHVGTFEQVYMDVACTKQEIEKGVSTHVELDPTSMLSVIANLTPFSDFNQSPRNMYQVGGVATECGGGSLAQRRIATRIADVPSAKWESSRWARRPRLSVGVPTTRW